MSALSLILFFFAGLAYGTKEATWQHPEQFRSLFPSAPDYLVRRLVPWWSWQWWDGSVSWKNKNRYRRTEAQAPPAFPASRWLGVVLTDAMHFFQMWDTVLTCAALSVAYTQQAELSIIAIFALASITYKSGHLITLHHLTSILILMKKLVKALASIYRFLDKIKDRSVALYSFVVFALGFLFIMLPVAGLNEYSPLPTWASVLIPVGVFAVVTSGLIYANTLEKHWETEDLLDKLS